MQQLHKAVLPSLLYLMCTAICMAAYYSVKKCQNVERPIPSVTSKPTTCTVHDNVNSRSNVRFSPVDSL